jgi:hypothetical protein
MVTRRQLQYLPEKPPLVKLHSIVDGKLVETRMKLKTYDGFEYTRSDDSHLRLEQRQSKGIVAMIDGHELPQLSGAYFAGTGNAKFGMVWCALMYLIVAGKETNQAISFACIIGSGLYLYSVFFFKSLKGRSFDLAHIPLFIGIFNYGSKNGDIIPGVLRARMLTLLEFLFFLSARQVEKARHILQRDNKNCRKSS